jgi:hypothetical protein
MRREKRARILENTSFRSCYSFGMLGRRVTIGLSTDVEPQGTGKQVFRNSGDQSMIFILYHRVMALEPREAEDHFGNWCTCDEEGDALLVIGFHGVGKWLSDVCDGPRS